VSPHPDALPAGTRYRFVSRVDGQRNRARKQIVLGVRDGDGDEMTCTCARCSALGYGDVADDILPRALLEDECPNEQPPTLTPRDDARPGLASGRDAHRPMSHRAQRGERPGRAISEANARIANWRRRPISPRRRRCSTYR
jgi:hypothetical protein